MMNNIQVLRAIAAITVVIHHVYVQQNGYILTELSKYIFFGIDIFLALCPL